VSVPLNNKSKQQATNTINSKQTKKKVDDDGCI
jgi:hypothetical protein